MEFYIGQIFMGGWTFPPMGSTYADGQLLAIASHTALFSLYGTQFGGDGRTDFGLPDLRGRHAMHKGTGSGLTPRIQGQKFGAETHLLTTQQMPSHNHGLTGGLTVGSTKGNTTVAANSFLGDSDGANPFYRTAAGSGHINGTSGITVGHTGGNTDFNIMNPTQVITYCVALVGIFPSRN